MGSASVVEEYCPTVAGTQAGTSNHEPRLDMCDERNEAGVGGNNRTRNGEHPSIPYRSIPTWMHAWVDA